jgi:hypothetical protein
VGAVAAGVELTSGDPSQVDAETLGLIGNSSAAATRKLKFLRAAMGVPAGHTGAVGELPGLVEGYLLATAGRNGPAALTWPSSNEVVAAASRIGLLTIPLLLNLCLVAHEAQPSCRALSLQLNAGAEIVVIAEGEPQRTPTWRQEILEVFATGTAAPTAKSIQAHLVKTLAAHAGGTLHLEAVGPTLRISFSIAQRV